MVGEFVEKRPQLLGELFPLGRKGDRGKGDAGKAGSELLAGRGVGIHDWRVGHRVVVD